MPTPTITDHATRLACLGVLALFTVACSDPGPAEKAGERLDDSIEAMGDRVDEAQREVSDAINPPGPAERAGRAVDDVVEEGEEAAEAMRRAVED
jgi:hypothetical protein